jgi:hypothetical protein
MDGVSSERALENQRNPLLLVKTMSHFSVPVHFEDVLAPRDDGRLCVANEIDMSSLSNADVKKMLDGNTHIRVDCQLYIYYDLYRSVVVKLFEIFD